MPWRYLTLPVWFLTGDTSCLIETNICIYACLHASHLRRYSDYSDEIHEIRPQWHSVEYGMQDHLNIPLLLN